MTRWRCGECGQVYNDEGTPPFKQAWCSGGQRHTRKLMVEVEPGSDADYQAILDDMGIPLDDPLRLAD